MNRSEAGAPARPAGKRSVVVLGSTGSVGRKALDAVRDRPDLFEIAGLSANTDIKGLALQAEEFGARYCAVSDPDAAREFMRIKPEGVALLSLDELSSLPADCFVNGLAGIAGLTPSLNVLNNGGLLGLANKEAVVAGGRFIRDAERRHGGTLVPVDSEHGAVWQCLRAGNRDEIRKITITASGGPFADMPAEELKNVTPEQALRHPVWKMGRKISVDSATLMNKGLEIIEAMRLFDLPRGKIDVLVHRTGTVHAFAEFVDGTVMACMSRPDMRVAVQLAMTWPERAETGLEFPDLAALGPLRFERLDFGKFPCLRLASEVSEDETLSIALSAADEVAVGAFLDGKISFTEIPDYIEKGLSFAGNARADSPGEVLELDAAVKERVRALLR